MNKKRGPSLKRPFYMGIAITLIAIAGIFTFLINIQNNQVSFSPGDNIHLPTDCSDAEIKATWDSIFKESSNGITIILDNPEDCYYFKAYKIKDGNVVTIMTNILIIGKGIVAMQANATQNEIDILTSDTIELSFSFSTEDQISLNDYFNKRKNSLIINNASNEFSKIFKIMPGQWESSTFANVEETFFSYSEIIDNNNNNNNNGVKGESGYVYANHTLSQYVYIDTSCTPSFQPIQETCQTTETANVWFNDTNSCGNTSSIPSNTTADCDYDRNKIIGKTSEISTSNFNKNVTIDDKSLNETKTYDEELIEIKDNNKPLIEFDWDFSSTLNLRNITIEKQSSSSSKGYVIVNGIETEKTIFLDNIHSTDEICIKDSHVNSISGISNDCDESNEYLLDCPDSKNGFDCSLSSDNETYIITGLSHSAVEEFVENNNDCESFWNCENWNECANGNQTRSCSDLNACASNKTETQTCTTFKENCNENWTCGEWQPTRCPIEEKQNRTCTDANNCGTTRVKKDTERTCTYTPSKTGLYILTFTFIGIIIIAIIIITFIVISKLKDKIIQTPNKKPEENYYY